MPLHDPYYSLSLTHEKTALYQASQKALYILENAGFEAFLVGGFVRDALLNHPTHDADLTTNAPYETMIKLFIDREYPVHPTGEKHGTLTVVIDGFPLEITRYRTDGIYENHRRPQSVTFVEHIQEDLARRDFTINAMAFNPRKGIIDPFGGQNDLQQGLIRCVGNASLRFEEDALRILRALRFASQLNFVLEDATARAIHEKAPLLSSVSSERLFSELTKLLCGKKPYPVLMAFSDVIFQLIPELADTKEFHQHTPYHIYTVYDHIAHCVQAIENDPLNRWVALLHDIGKPATYAPDEKGCGHFPGHAKRSAELAQDIAERFKMPRAFSDDLIVLIARHDEAVEETPRAVKRMLRKLKERPDLFQKLCAMKRADTLSQAPCCLPRLENIAHLQQILADVLDEKPALSRRNLAVNGNDLIAHGYMPSPAFHEALEAALDAVVDERVANTADALWDFWEREGVLDRLSKTYVKKRNSPE